MVRVLQHFKHTTSSYIMTDKAYYKYKPICSIMQAEWQHATKAKHGPYISCNTSCRTMHTKPLRW